MIRGIDSTDKKSFEILFHKYYASLCFFANKYLQDEESSRDIVQEVFIRFFQKKMRFPEENPLRIYLYKCVHTKCLNLLEKRNIRMAARRRLKEDELVEDAYFFHSVETSLFEEIFKAIEELPVECCRIFKMSYLENMDVRRISEELQISESTVKTQRQRAKKYLRQRLKNLYAIMAILCFP